MKRQVHVFYSGRVQGVGFRITAEEVASALSVLGWVRNLPDGRVELVAEAEEQTLERLIEMIRTGPMKNFIHQVDVSWSPASETLGDFRIRYY